MSVSSPRTMKIGERLSSAFVAARTRRFVDRTENVHTEVTEQTEYEMFFSVSPVASVLTLFSVSSVVGVNPEADF